MSLLARSRMARPWLAALAAATVVHLGLILVAPGAPTEIVTKALLMPLLAGVLVTAAPRPWPRVVRLIVLALALSWLGDVVPEVVDHPTPVLIAVAFFLLAQLAYVAAFWPWRRSSLVARKPLLLLPYLAALATLLLLVRDGVGGLLVAVVVYGVVLTSMAVLASGLGRLATVGGALFMLSDALLAISVFTDPDLPAHGVWVMLTYVVGQLLIVEGALGNARADAAPFDERLRPGGRFTRQGDARGPR